MLFDWLTRFKDNGDAAFHDQTEQRALWDIDVDPDAYFAER